MAVAVSFIKVYKSSFIRGILILAGLVFHPGWYCTSVKNKVRVGGGLLNGENLSVKHDKIYLLMLPKKTLWTVEE